MIELRRKQLKPIEMGELCKMRSSVVSAIKGLNNYREEGNAIEDPMNLLKRLHVADVNLFYVANDAPFNSKELLELVPLDFTYDSTYRPRSFEQAMRTRMKIVMRRKDFFLIQNPMVDLDHPTMIEKRMDVVAKKFKLNLEPWKKYLENR